MSADPCGCDVEAGWVCAWHRADADRPDEQLDTLPRYRPCANCDAPAEVDDPTDQRPAICAACYVTRLTGEC